MSNLSHFPIILRKLSFWEKRSIMKALGRLRKNLNHCPEELQSTNSSILATYGQILGTIYPNDADFIELKNAADNYEKILDSLFF